MVKEWWRHKRGAALKPPPSEKDTQSTGYMSAEYGKVFRHLGRIVILPESGLQLIERQIRPGLSDLMGLYPYAMCRTFAALAGPADLAAMRATGAVAVSFVADPFATDMVQTALANWAVCRRFKTHFVIDLADGWHSRLARTTRRYIRRGHEAQTTRIVTADASGHAPEFWALYAPAMRRLGASGIQKMSPDMIADQLAVPGVFLTLSHARDSGTLTGAMISYVHDSHVSAHLVGFDATPHTSYVLIDAGASHAESLGCRWFNIGGPAGMKDDPSDGLYAFKRRWTPHQRETMLCGQILNPGAYAALCAETDTQDAGFFPAYRAPGSPYEWHLEL